MAPQERTARRILVVDDEPMLSKAIGMMLALDGHEVETATNGEEALAAFQMRRFDLVVTDYAMPGMSGDKLAAAIKALAPNQPIILITAYAESLRSERKSPLLAGVVMDKPFDMQRFREAVRQLTATASGA
jgi:CheY-like chemotaxis protein